MPYPFRGFLESSEREKKVVMAPDIIFRGVFFPNGFLGKLVN